MILPYRLVQVYYVRYLYEHIRAESGVPYPGFCREYSVQSDILNGTPIWRSEPMAGNYRGKRTDDLTPSQKRMDYGSLWNCRIYPD